MIKQLLGTTFSRISITLIGFSSVVLATRFLGAETYGSVSLFLLSLTILQLFSGMAGGPALVYLIPRQPFRSLFITAALWTLGVHILVLGFYFLFPFLVPTHAFHLIGVSLLFFLYAFAVSGLLGKEKIKTYNMLSILQASLIPSSLLFQYYVLDTSGLTLYIRSLYISYGVSSLAAWSALWPYCQNQPSETTAFRLGSMLRHGSYLQLANGLQLFNYRLSWLLIDQFLGRSYLGIYAVSTQLAEGIWIFGKSFAVVQYSKISNTHNMDYAARITIRLTKIALLIAALGLTILLTIPVKFYLWIFGQEFAAIKEVVLYMAIGIWMLTASQLFSHYFSGTGRQHHNAISAAIGLGMTVLFGIILIPYWGLKGAGITASLAYGSSTLYQLFRFLKISKSHWTDFLINRSDFEACKELFRGLRN